MASKAILETVNDQQELFCQDYATRLNAAESAERAGYSREYGRQLLALPNVAERIAEIQRKSGVRMVVDQSRVIREAAYLGFSDITEALGVNSLADLKALPENVRRAIRRVKVTLTPMRRDGSPDRRSQRTTEGQEAIDENGDARISELASPEYQQTIEIEMHPKEGPLKLLALVTQAVKDPEDMRKQAPSFTGMSITVAGDKSEQKSKKRSKDDD